MTTESEKIKEGCGKDFTLEREDYECGGEIETDKFESGCGFLLCPTCQARLEGFQAGENSKHKSDLQQELEKWEEVNKVIPEIKSRAKAYCGTMTNGTVLPTPRDWLKKKVNENINLIKKELEILG